MGIFRKVVVCRKKEEMEIRKMYFIFDEVKRGKGNGNKEKYSR